jgi:hypothetical protein
VFASQSPVDQITRPRLSVIRGRCQTQHGVFSSFPTPATKRLRSGLRPESHWRQKEAAQPPPVDPEDGILSFCDHRLQPFRRGAFPASGVPGYSLAFLAALAHGAARSNTSTRSTSRTSVRTTCFARTHRATLGAAASNSNAPSAVNGQNL